METLVIYGGNKLHGGIRVQGAKNGALPVLAASVLGGRSEIRSCPRLSDTDSSLDILRMLGCEAERDGETVTVDASRVPRCDIPPELMRRMRSSVIFLGAAREPEITELAEFINAKGGRISGAGGDVVIVDGVEELGDCEHVCIPDRIAAATYIAAAAATGSELTLYGAEPKHIKAVISAFSEAGCRFRESGGGLTVTAPERLKAVRFVRTAPYPGFPTDAQPLLAAALAFADGISVINETVFDGRFRYLRELERFGADARCEGSLAVIRGKPFLTGANAECTDLRGGAALVVAALGATGRSEISAIRHIARGYENVEAAFAAAGAKIYGNVKNETAHAGDCFREASGV